jgi:glycine rich protein
MTEEAMADSRATVFNSAPFISTISEVATRETSRVGRRVAWLTILVVGCLSPMFSQNSSMGVQEYTANATFTVPPGTSALRIDAYGAGGGGGGGDSTFNGGGGGAGAYTAGVINVSPGEVLTIVVGKGGAGGLAGSPAATGSAGGTTKIVNSSNVVVASANGGKGGQGATSTANGSGGSGGAAGTLGGVRHAGQNGFSGSPGYGYVPVGFSVIFVESGKFGTGGQGGGNGGNGLEGQPGYILITW